MSTSGHYGQIKTWAIKALPALTTSPYVDSVRDVSIHPSHPLTQSWKISLTRPRIKAGVSSIIPWHTAPSALSWWICNELKLDHERLLRVFYFSKAASSARALQDYRSEKFRTLFGKDYVQTQKLSSLIMYDVNVGMQLTVPIFFYSKSWSLIKFCLNNCKLWYFFPTLY